MTSVLHLLMDAALAAAQLLALLFVPPALATQTEPVASGIRAERAAESAVRLHRLSTALDAQLLGGFADVRVDQRVRNDRDTLADLGAALPAVDQRVDASRVIRPQGVADVFAKDVDCGAEVAGHAQLTCDEAIADASQPAPHAEVFALQCARPLIRGERSCRIELPAAMHGDTPRALLVDRGDQWSVVVVPQREAANATLVLRPSPGAAETFELGAVDSRSAVLIRVASQGQLRALAAGAVEIEWRTNASTIWTTVATEGVTDMAGASGTLQANADE